MVAVKVVDQSAATAALDELLPHSEIHRRWPRGAVWRCLHSPIYCDQYLLLFEGGEPVGFLSWAWLSPEAETGYLDGSRLLQGIDFPRTSPEDVLWVIDLLAPFGHVRQLCRLAQRVLGPVCVEHGLAGVKIRRGSRRQGFFPARKVTA